MNWGTGITLVILLFVVSMLGMVFVAANQTNELFDKDYYQKELQYQKLIDAHGNLANITSSDVARQDADRVYLHIPIETTQNISASEVEFLKMDNKKMDKKFTLVLDEGNVFSVPKTELEQGTYLVRAYWKSMDKPYYFETKILVKK